MCGYHVAGSNSKRKHLVSQPMVDRTQPDEVDLMFITVVPRNVITIGRTAVRAGLVYSSGHTCDKLAPNEQEGISCTRSTTTSSSSSPPLSSLGRTAVRAGLVYSSGHICDKLAPNEQEGISCTRSTTTSSSSSPHCPLSKTTTSCMAGQVKVVPNKGRQLHEWNEQNTCASVTSVAYSWNLLQTPLRTRGSELFALCYDPGSNPSRGGLSISWDWTT